MERHFKTVSTIPKTAKKTQLIDRKSGKPYTINLLFFKDDLKRIQNRSEKLVSAGEITIYFPFEEKLYGKRVEKRGGFTVDDLAKAAHLLALRVMKRVVKHHPEAYPGLTPEQIVAGYGLLSFRVSGSQVFIEADHRVGAPTNE